MNNHSYYVHQTKKNEPSTALDSQLRRSRRCYFASVLIDTVGTGMWIPVSLIFFTRAAHIPATQVGGALTIGGIVGLLCGPIGGTLVDRWGPAPFALLSMLIRAMIFVVYPFVGSAWQVAALSAVFAASDRLFWTSNAPLLYQLASGRELDSLLGSQSMVRVIGIGIGAAVSGVLAGSISGLDLLSYCNAASYIVASIALWLSFSRPTLARKRTVDPASSSSAGNWRTVLADRPYVLLCFVYQLYVFGSESLVVILPLVAVETLHGPVWLAGGSVVVGNIVLVTAQKPVIRLSRRWPRRNGILTATPLFIAAFAVMIAGPILHGAGVVIAVMAASILGVLSEAFYTPLLTSAANEVAPDALRGRYSAMLQLTWGISGVISPALFTSLLSVGNSVLWLSLVGMMAVTVPGLIFASKLLPPGVLRRP